MENRKVAPSEYFEVNKKTRIPVPFDGMIGSRAHEPSNNELLAKVAYIGNLIDYLYR